MQTPSDPRTPGDHLVLAERTVTRTMCLKAQQQRSAVFARHKEHGKCGSEAKAEAGTNGERKVVDNRICRVRQQAGPG